jgi:hypothetical protein
MYLLRHIHSLVKRYQKLILYSDMATKIHPFKNRINIPMLRYHLCFNRNKLPKEFDFLGDVPVYSDYKEPLGLYRIKVYPHIPQRDEYEFLKSSKHRIFVLCSCGREIPAGRVTQHTHNE